MSTTSNAPQATSSDSTSPNAGAAQNNQNMSIKTFAASLSTAAVIFGVQMALFLIFSGNWKIRSSSPERIALPTQRQSLWKKI